MLGIAASKLFPNLIAGMDYRKNNKSVLKGFAEGYGKEITDRFLAGEALAKSVVEEWITKIALHCLSIIVAINPEMLCIGGGISEEDWFIEAVKTRYHALCLDHFANVEFLTTKIERCRFRNDANLLGATLNAEMTFPEYL